MLSWGCEYLKRISRTLAVQLRMEASLTKCSELGKRFMGVLQEISATAESSFRIDPGLPQLPALSLR